VSHTQTSASTSAAHTPTYAEAAASPDRPGLVRLISVGLVSLLGGCGHLETHRVDFAAAARPPGEAHLFVSALPTRPYAEVGLVQAIGYGGESTAPSVLRGLQREGKKMGCDAIVKVRVDVGQTAAHASGVCVTWEPGAQGT
jgi:hypothetical protein